MERAQFRARLPTPGPTIRQLSAACGLPAAANWQNEHEYSVSLGGPIKKNKTFFFFLWDQQFERDRTQMRPVVLTDCARNGIFRYWEGYQNGNLNTLTERAWVQPIP